MTRIYDMTSDESIHDQADRMDNAYREKLIAHYWGAGKVTAVPNLRLVVSNPAPPTDEQVLMIRAPGRKS